MVLYPLPPQGLMAAPFKTLAGARSIILDDFQAANHAIFFVNCYCLTFFRISTVFLGYKAA
jgi:hypothetical protein